MSNIRLRSIGQVECYGGLDRNTHTEKTYGYVKSCLGGQFKFFKHNIDTVIHNIRKGCWVAYYPSIVGSQAYAKNIIPLHEDAHPTIFDNRIPEQAHKVPIHILVHCIRRSPKLDQIKIARTIKSNLSKEKFSHLVRNLTGHLLLPESEDLRQSILTRIELFELFSSSKNPNAYHEEISRLTKTEITSPLSVRDSNIFWQNQPDFSPSDILFQLAPDSYKSRYWRNLYSDLPSVLDAIIREPEYPTIKAREVYRDLTDNDRTLARHWQKADTTFEEAKMIAARAAEKWTKQFYEKLDFTVSDVAIHQLQNVSDAWRTHDLYVKDHGPIDVKNARHPKLNRDFYTEHTVKSFKRSESSEECKVVGVLSPYLKIQVLNNPDSIPYDTTPLRVLGETCLTYLSALEREFESEFFKVSIVRDLHYKLPYWTLEFPDNFYVGSRKPIEKIRLVPNEAWQYLYDRIATPAFFLRAGVNFPNFCKNQFEPWQNRFVESIESKFSSLGITRPVLTLSIITDFLQNLQSASPSPTFRPGRYRDLLFSSKMDYRGRRTGYSRLTPCGLYDPLGYIYELIAALDQVWTHRETHKLNVSSMRYFELRSLGILRGRNSSLENWKTIFTWCGGRPTDKGPCGNFPLVMGRHPNCPTCGYLICERCNFCSIDCSGMNEQTHEDLNW